MTRATSTSPKLTILFQGDSITNAFRRPEEINPAYQLGAGYALLVGARLARRYPGQIQLINRGISGQTVGELAKRWQADTLSNQPDLVSLLIGVNSTIRHFWGLESESIASFESTYAALMEACQQANPQTRWVILEPFLVPAGVVTPEWSAHLRELQECIKKLAVQAGAAYIPLQAIFDSACESAPPEYWAYDGIHPTHAGAALIADAWLETMEPEIRQQLRA